MLLLTCYTKYTFLLSTLTTLNCVNRVKMFNYENLKTPTYEHKLSIVVTLWGETEHLSGKNGALR